MTRDWFITGATAKIKRSIVIKFLLVITALFISTSLRPVMLVLLPVFLVSLAYLLNLHLTRNILYLLLIIFLAGFIGIVYTNELNMANHLTSLYLILPLILLMFSRVKTNDTFHNNSYFEFFIGTLTVIFIFNNVYGIIQFIQIGNDDSFIGFYGRHGLNIHTLSLANYLLCSFYFFRYKQQKNSVDLYLCVFFMISAIMGFFGLGLIVFLFAVFLYNISWKRLFQTIFIFAFVLSILASLLYLIKEETFNYNRSNLEAFYEAFTDKENFEYDQEKYHPVNLQTPRKLILHYNYAKVYLNDIVLFIFGSGPGTFNSRTSFLLNGDYSDISFIKNTFKHTNVSIAREHVFPLWNSRILSRPYMDGTRNEPFSAIVAILSEYGFFVFLIVVLLFRSRLKRIFKSFDNLLNERNDLNYYYFYKRYLKFVIIFMTLNLFCDNYLEYPEFILLIVLVIKLIEMKVNSLKQQITPDT
ncbi:hypothetical protein QQ008_09695 [Fulvivirgaceae bacterium BMA10]|uniref:Uncharacterized protein n=1 Tax=Splendidivirga corallicola TaxID=3051826 RepID=A0ABT8KLP5_9BACT|nr:hypothetical protein [Fulvivirgaceae bacterium BMA10]